MSILPDVKLIIFKSLVALERFVNAICLEIKMPLANFVNMEMESTTACLIAVTLEDHWFLKAIFIDLSNLMSGVQNDIHIDLIFNIFSNIRPTLLPNSQRSLHPECWLLRLPLCQQDRKSLYQCND